MKLRLTLILFFALNLLSLMVVSPTPSTKACAPAPAKGTKVFIAQEAAIIVWDAANKTQHFIRRASFETRSEIPSVASRDFGFLVPTPTVPELAEADDAAFGTMAETMRPAIVQENRYTVESIIFSKSFGTKREFTGSSAPKDDVRVLHTQRVAGYDAVVLEADNAQALNDWLLKHGYAVRATLTEWLNPYVAAKWKLTAFKIAPQEKSKDPEKNGKEERRDRAVSTSAVRMSFKTERPFFPYREPTDQVELAKEFNGNRVLQVFFIGTARMAGELGEKANPWSATTKWAGPIPGQHLATLTAQLKLPEGNMPTNPWLTALEDRSSHRPSGDDVFFVHSLDQNAVLPPPIVHYYDIIIPIEGMLCVLMVVGLVGLVIILRRKKKAL